MNDERPLVPIAGIDEPVPDDAALTETRTKRVAAMAIAGGTKGAIAKSLGLSVYAVGKIFKSEEFKSLVETTGDDAISTSKAMVRTEIARLGRKAVLVIEKNLDKHNLEAAKAVLRALGLDGADKDGADKGAFTLILANKQEPKSIVVVEKDDDE